MLAWLNEAHGHGAICLPPSPSWAHHRAAFKAERLSKMAAFLRSKQIGMSNDLSAGILPDSFAPDDQARYGINSQIRSGPSSISSPACSSFFEQHFAPENIVPGSC